MPFKHYQLFHKVWATRRHKKCCMSAHRLADNDRFLARRILFKNRDDIVYESRTGYVLWPSSAIPMSPLVDEHYAEGLRERGSGGQQLTRAAGKAVEQHQWRAIASKVRDRDGHALAVNKAWGLVHHAFKSGVSGCRLRIVDGSVVFLSIFLPTP